MSKSGSPNWSNQTIWTGDNLDIMRGMNSESVDLIYLDPPFNSNHDYAAPIGGKAAGAAFKDTWGLDDVNIAWHGEIKHEYPGLYSLLTATREIHGDSMTSYLIYMAIRVMEMRRVLKPSGSIYLHCDPTASHYLKLLMDSLFGARRCRNEIIWHYRRWPAQQRNFQRMHDVILFYSRADAGNRFNVLFNPLSEGTKKRWRGNKSKVTFKDGVRQVTQMTGAKSKGAPMDDVWHIPVINSQAKERTGYPTQKPLALLDRVIKASSDPGAIVLDPFCGCATACISAERLQRQWIGIDISPKAADLVVSRMHDELGLFFKGVHRTDIPKRNDMGQVIRYNDEKNKRWLYGEQGGYCNGCKGHFPPRNMTIDHIIPRSKGGTDHISNLQLLCGACNSLKGNRPQEYLLACLTDKGWIKRQKKAA